MKKKRFDVLLIGASVGGPGCLERILVDIGDEIPVPVAIVQHMADGFIGSLVARLEAEVPFEVCVAQQRKAFVSNQVYFAPTGKHLRFERQNAGIVTVLSRHPQDAQHIPSVDILFESGLAVFGSHVLAVLLTGMGNDGAKSMLALKNAGAYTIAQGEASCVVYGMPGAAIQLNAVCESIELPLLGKRLRDLLREE